MEKLTIKPWQVMQAHENGADVHGISTGEWCFSQRPLWDWINCNYRIANLTADGMRLDELVENHYAKDDCNLIDVLKSKECNHLFAATSNSYGGLLLFLIEHPECIAQVKVKQEKKLRPWTMEEFEKHRDEWFLSKSGSKRKVIHFSNNTLLPAWYGASVTYKEFMESFNREDGSPCGVLE